MLVVRRMFVRVVFVLAESVGLKFLIRKLMSSFSIVGNVLVLFMWMKVLSIFS